jgi:hypothetical protein
MINDLFNFIKLNLIKKYQKELDIL